MSPPPSGSDDPRAEAVALAVAEGSQVGEARRAAAALAGRLGFDDIAAGKLALVVTEAATNLVKHARGGEVLLRAVAAGPVPGVEVLALDRGPGIGDLGRCLRDGYSTTGTAGTGLGAILRLSGQFDIYTAPPVGTALLARLWARPPAGEGAAGAMEAGVVSLAKPGESVCGDGWAVEELPGRALVLVADGLGHGPGAAEAARAAVRGFRDNRGRGPVPILQALHGLLRPTRGAAAAVAEIDPAGQALRYAGVGNIAGAVHAAGATHNLVSHNGTLGLQIYKVQEFAYPFPKGALLVMHSDGLGTSWRLDRYPGLTARHPSLVAGVLYRDFKRGRDDVTVLAVREEPA